MSKKVVRAKRKKLKSSPQELKALKEQQRLLYLRQRRKARQRQLLFHRVKALIRLGTVIFMFLGALYLMLLPQWRLSPFVFQIYPNQNLVLKDNMITKDKQIMHQLSNQKIPDKPLYLLNTDKYKKALLELDSIENVFIRRYWLPSRLIITIKEKQPLFTVYNDVNSLPEYAINSDGSRLGKDYLPLPEKYQNSVFKIVTGNNAKEFEGSEIEKIEKIIKIAEKATGEKLIYLDLRNNKDVYLNMTGCLIRLGQIDATIIERVSRLQAIMDSVKPLEDKIEYIDLRWDNALSLKEKQEKKAQKTASHTSTAKPEPEPKTEINNENEKPMAAQLSEIIDRQ